MTYFADLTDYSYIPSGHASHATTKNVGWLSAAHAFDTAAPTEELLDRLWSYCTISVAQTRGIHQCEFCPDKDAHFAQRKNDKLLLGTSEIRVFAGEDCIYAAPTLIYHYGKDHDYKPPKTFIRALIADPAPPAVEYIDRLTRASLRWQKTSVAQESVSIYQPSIANQLAPQFTSNNKTKPALQPAIRLRDIALLVVGGIIFGGAVGILVGVPIWGITHSNFAILSAFGICIYGSLIVGYQRLSQRLQWTGLRARFAPVGKAILIVSALGGLGLVVFTASFGAILEWAGFKVDHAPTPEILPHDWLQLPLAVLVIVIVGPVCEELLFRGLLLDWLKQKMNVWAAAVILSVIFSLLHANPFSLGAVGWLAFSHRMLLGLAASALAIRYHSLRPSLVMHATLNAIACFTSVLNLD